MDLNDLTERLRNTITNAREETEDGPASSRTTIDLTDVAQEALTVLEAIPKIQAKRDAVAKLDREERAQNGASAWAAIYQARVEGFDMALGFLRGTSS